MGQRPALPKTLEQLHEMYPTSETYTVEYRDLDAMQHVNNTVYFSYFERIRIRHFLNTVDSEFSFHPEGIKPIVSETFARFRRPVNFDDRVVVGVRVAEADPLRGELKEEYIVWSTAQSAVAATGGCTVVVCDFDKGGKRAVIPEAWLDAMQPAARLS